jgi:hypothetical protein
LYSPILRGVAVASVLPEKVKQMKAVWFAENEIKEPMKCEICGKAFKEGFVFEPESQADVEKLRKRFPFVTDLYQFIFVSEDCLYKNFSSKTQLYSSKGNKLSKPESRLKGEL